MDLATLLGIIIGFVMVVIGIITSTTNPTLKGIMDTFVDIPSIAVTIGGSMAGMLTSYTFKTFLGHLKGFGIAMKDPKLDNGQVISKIIELSNTARKEGLLALEEVAQGLDDEFMKKGILLIVDGTEPELVRGILETELVNLDTRHKSTIGFFDNWAALAPAWGMIGTLLGLVNMLKNLSDTASIGPNMAVALLTTLYGSLIAHSLASLAFLFFSIFCTSFQRVSLSAYSAGAFLHKNISEYITSDFFVKSWRSPVSLSLNFCAARYAEQATALLPSDRPIFLIEQ